MRPERVLAWVVLYAGMATMIATSGTDDDDEYGVRSYASAIAQVHSEGAEDAKIARLTITRSGSLRPVSGELDLTIRGVVSRPAADLIFALLHAPGDGQDAGLDEDAGAPQTRDAGLLDAGLDHRFRPDAATHGTHRPMSRFTEIEVRGMDFLQACADDELCTTVHAVYVRAQAPEPFSLELTAHANFVSYSSYADADAGASTESELSLTIEVVDAP